ncbi:hypothetical protein [Crocosphaera sp. UHCC 0190]|uniref:hypothetical protein n=1 Tax=Crocosphaera sp. UHCC 0190 TaxID=3110246 RepID=UPI002B208B9D|nr:hypothetical protein [Crocosphaera sp. UHCC 0190]
MNRPFESLHLIDHLSSGLSSQPTPIMPSQTDKGLQHNVPIPLPSHPRQYRAIGLIEGQYQRSEGQMTRGLLTTKEGTTIDAVILGKVISVLKKHVDLDQPHLWVVYPRIRLTNDQLQLQIAGVWEPETLQPSTYQTLDSLSSTEASLTSPTIPIKSGYFSIRGEVVYVSPQKKTVIIKIRQSPKSPSEKTKFFKLKLKGTLPDKSVGHFWDLQVQLEQDILILKTGTNLGHVPKKKPVFRNNHRSVSQFPPQKPVISGDRSPSSLKTPSPRLTPLPKPVKHHQPKPQPNSQDILESEGF